VLDPIFGLFMYILLRVREAAKHRRKLRDVNDIMRRGKRGKRRRPEPHQAARAIGEAHYEGNPPRGLADTRPQSTREDQGEGDANTPRREPPSSADHTVQAASIKTTKCKGPSE
jgi:hypothetical protein